jgi:hypothetical protein
LSPRGLRTLVAEPYRGKLPWRYLVRFRPPLGPVDERLGFVTRIRRIRQIKTPLGFRTEQITNAYRVHEPSHGFGLLAVEFASSGPARETVMPDEHTLLERRITWIEREVVRLILVAIGAFSIFVGGLAYEFSVDRVGGWGAACIMLLVFGTIAWCLYRHEFKDAPAHVKRMARESA